MKRFCGIGFCLANMGLILLSLQCSKSKSSTEVPAAKVAEQNALEYFQSSTTIALEVWYEPKAEPFTKTSATDIQYWDIIHDNMEAIFQFRRQKPELIIPTSTAEMHELGDQNKESWTSQELMALSAAHNTGNPPAGTSRFLVYFLNGYFNKGKGPEKNVLGVHLGGSRMVAMFKPVIDGTSTGPLDRVAKYVEQSTLVHEVGHALGFVNNGVPMSKAYQDKEHGAHSTNSECVMYWLNEGPGDMAKFILKFLDSKSLVMWGPEILEDAKAISK